MLTRKLSGARGVGCCVRRRAKIRSSHKRCKPLRSAEGNFTRYLQLVVKRAFDIAASATVLLVLSPLFLLASLAIKFETRGPVFSVKHVYCHNSQPVRVLAFRTRSHRSVTAFGRVLVRIGLDQLPVLINVLRGDMSIVGPHSYVLPPPQLYNQQSPAGLGSRFRPGLIGFKGSNAGRDLSRTDADLFYISNWSLLLDLKILVLHLFSMDTYFQSRPHR